MYSSGFEAIWVPEFASQIGADALADRVDQLFQCLGTRSRQAAKYGRLAVDGCGCCTPVTTGPLRSW
jgi:hypothetical protein